MKLNEPGNGEFEKENYLQQATHSMVGLFSNFGLKDGIFDSSEFPTNGTLFFLSAEPRCVWR